MYLCIIRRRERHRLAVPVGKGSDVTSSRLQTARSYRVPRATRVNSSAAAPEATEVAIHTARVVVAWISAPARIGLSIDPAEKIAGSALTYRPRIEGGARETMNTLMWIALRISPIVHTTVERRYKG